MVKEQRVVTMSEADGLLVEMTAADGDLDWGNVKPKGVRGLRSRITEVLRGASKGDEADEETEGRDGPGE